MILPHDADTFSELTLLIQSQPQKPTLGHVVSHPNMIEYISASLATVLTGILGIYALYQFSQKVHEWRKRRGDDV